MPLTENKYQAKLIKRIQDIYPEAIILKNDANYLQGIPDWTILYKKRWVMFDVKKDANAVYQPNQEWYLNYADEQGYFGSFVYPENEQDFLEKLATVLNNE